MKKIAISLSLILSSCIINMHAQTSNVNHYKYAIQPNLSGGKYETIGLLFQHNYNSRNAITYQLDYIYDNLIQGNINTYEYNASFKGAQAAVSYKYYLNNANKWIRPYVSTGLVIGYSGFAYGGYFKVTSFNSQNNDIYEYKSNKVNELFFGNRSYLGLEIYLNKQKNLAFDFSANLSLLLHSQYDAVYRDITFDNYNIWKDKSLHGIGKVEWKLGIIFNINKQ